MIYQGAARYPVDTVVLHTPAFDDPARFLRDHPTPQAQAEWIRELHMSPGWQGAPNGWSDAGYHYFCGIIMEYVMGRLAMTGVQIVPLRPETKIGAHVREANRGTLGVCMMNIAPHNGITRFEDYFLEWQRQAVKSLIADIARRTDLVQVRGHNDYTDLKECPGFKVNSADWMPAPPWWRRWFPLFT